MSWPLCSRRGAPGRKTPRLTRALQTLLRNAKWSSDSSKPMWRVAFELTQKSGDPQFKTLEPEFKVRPAMHAWLLKQFNDAIAELPAQFDPTDDTEWKKAVAAKGPKKVKKVAVDEASLLAVIYENPSDDAPRRVLADLLMESGDPRGEFIMLQCTGADPKRARALLKANEKAWLAPFEDTLRDVEWQIAP
ncbi:MAG: TIGR02996 domain-containing protein [Myxococcales bacterium]|nr:TIGR02996 domain-containing protein [Myxococcales bacterium]